MMARRMITISPAIKLVRPGSSHINTGLAVMNELMPIVRRSISEWKIVRVADDVILAQSRTDTEGTMAALYATGEMGSAPPLASYLASKATVNDSTLTDAMRYTYLGDKHTDDRLAGMRCNPVRRPDGKCVVSMKMATALVIDERGCLHVVARRRLRVMQKGGKS